MVARRTQRLRCLPSLLFIRRLVSKGNIYRSNPDLTYQDKTMFVPVVDANQKPLMPTTTARARKWIKSGKATPFFKKGVFCVRLNTEPSDRKTQSVAVGIDPGSKKEGFTVKSKAHTYLNVQVDTPPWANEKVKTGPNKGKNKTTLQRAQMRRARRYRQTPYRQCRPHRNIRHLRMPPSTRSRWELKLNVCKWLVSMFPITDFVVEDIKASTKKQAKKWNQSFSPLEIGKQWFYYQLNRM